MSEDKRTFVERRDQGDNAGRGPGPTNGESKKTIYEVLEQIRTGADAFKQAVDGANKRISETIGPISEAIQKFDQGLKQVQESFRPIVERFQQNKLEAKRLSQVAQTLEQAGWFPWVGLPFSDLAESTDPVKDFEAWLDKAWPDIENILQKQLRLYGLGDSVASTLKLALSAHADGYFELVPRILYPEIEKCAGLYYYSQPSPHGQTNLPEIREVLEAIWQFAGGAISYFKPSIGPAANQMNAVGQYVYSNWRTCINEPLAKYFPNRNRVLHGIHSDVFNNKKASVNSILIFASMITGIAVAKAMGITPEEFRQYRSPKNGTP
jgi:hypothetical protein